MTDPYKVLGVSPNADMDEVKQAYRRLAKKYHPDNYVNNPLSNLAEEKMKEINEAYDAIVKGYTAKSESTSGSGYANGQSSLYAEVRQAILSGNIALAETLLSGISHHDAEWNFLMGSVMMRKGWYDEARRYFSTACSMEPNNAEYRAALRRMSVFNTNPAGQSVDPCDCCAGMMCANCMCDCCGGMCR